MGGRETSRERARASRRPGGVASRWGAGRRGGEPAAAAGPHEAVRAEHPLQAAHTPGRQRPPKAGASNFAMIPEPAWMGIVGLLQALPLAWLGAKALGRASGATRK